MASITLQVGAEYTTGTTVSVYNSVNSVPVAPVGNAVTTGAVGSDGTVSFSGLTGGLNYLAYAASGTPQYVRFYVPTPAGTVGGSGLPSLVVTKTSAYTASGGDLVLANATSAGFTVTLPSGPADGTLVAVKKVDSTLNTVTIAASGAGTIDGQATASTQTQWAGAIFEHRGSDVWVIAAAMSVTGPASTVAGPAGPQGPVATSLTITQQSGTTYTLVLADAGTEVETTNASAVALTVPPNSSVAFPVGSIVNVRQYGGGQVTITAGGGVTLRSPNGAKTAHQYSTVTLVKRATDEWIVGGDTTT